MPAVQVGIIQVWIASQRRIEVIERALQRPLAQEDRAAIVERHRNVGTQLDGLVEVRHRMVIIALLHIGPAAADESYGIVRIGFHLFAEGDDRLVVVVLGDQRVAARGQRYGQILARQLPAAEQVLAGREPDARICLAVAAGFKVVGQQGTGNGRHQRRSQGQAQQQNQRNKGARHSRNAPGGGIWRTDAVHLWLLRAATPREPDQPQPARCSSG